MIRYITEKQIDFNKKSRSVQDKNQTTQIEKHQSMSEIPENNENSSKALRQLKKINDHKEMLKGRLSFLQIQQQKNEFKSFLNEHRYQFHQQMRDQMQKQREEKARHLKNVYQKLLQTQQKAKYERQTHNMNLKNAQNQLNMSKFNDYKQTKERRQLIERSISQIKKDEGQTKRQRYQQIREYEKAQKNHVQEYMKNKISELKMEDSQAAQKFSRIREQRAKQIEELAKLQSIMIQKQARSKMSSEQSQKKLKKLLGDKKPVSTSHTTKLPYISAQKRQKSEREQQDILVL